MKRGTIQINGKSYTIDAPGFLEDFFQWDERFATFMALRYSIPSARTRNACSRTGTIGGLSRLRDCLPSEALMKPPIRKPRFRMGVENG